MYSTFIDGPNDVNVYLILVHFSLKLHYDTSVCNKSFHLQIECKRKHTAI